MKRSLLLAVLAAGATVVILGATGSFAQGGAGNANNGPPSLQCDSGDQVLGMQVNRSGDGRASSAEDAVEKEVTTTYPGLKASAFARSNEKSDAVELSFTRGGRRLAVVDTEKIGSGWGVESMVACNSLLVEMKGGGR